MATKSQSFDSHTRWFALYHFFASPVTGLYAIYALVQFLRNPQLSEFFEVLFVWAVFAGILASRLMAITVQNRLIRFEMRLRLKELLPANLQPRIKELRVTQLIALRFAGDAELPGLVERTLNGEFATGKDIKRAITDWQPDFLRA